MDKAKTRPATVTKETLVDKTYDIYDKVEVIMLTRRPKVMRFRHRELPEDKQLEFYNPKKTEYGSNLYVMSIAAFIKFKGGEWGKYFLVSDCKIDIEVPNGRGGKEIKTVYPVVEQVIKDPNKEGFVPVLNYQGLPVLIDVFDKSKDSELKKDFFKPPVVTP
jgi:hypothetical protein